MAVAAGSREPAPLAPVHCTPHALPSASARQSPNNQGGPSCESRVRRMFARMRAELDEMASRHAAEADRLREELNQVRAAFDELRSVYTWSGCYGGWWRPQCRRAPPPSRGQHGGAQALARGQL